MSASREKATAPSIADADQTDLVYWYSRAFDRRTGMQEEHKVALGFLARGEHGAVDLKVINTNPSNPKIKLFRIKYNDAGRLLLTLREIDGELAWLVLEDLPTHDYKKAHFLRRGVLARFLQKDDEEDDSDKETDSEEEIDVTERELNEAEQALLKKLKRNTRDNYRPVDFIDGKLAEFNQQQQEARAMGLPSITDGHAGSGKTFVAQGLIEDLSPQMDGKDVIYLAESEELVRKMKAQWDARPIKLPTDSNVKFMTYRQLAASIDDKVAQLKDEDFVGKKEGDAWLAKQWGKGGLFKNIDRLIKKETAEKTAFEKLQENKEKLYEEFRIISGCSSEEMYAKLGNDESSFPRESQQRKWAWQAYQAYLKQLNGKIDLALCSLTQNSGKTDKIGAIIVDEALDLSCMQINQLIRASKFKIALFNGSLQNLKDRISTRPYQKKLLPRAKNTKLKKILRYSKKIKKIADIIEEIRRLLHGGVSNKDEVIESEADETATTKGEVYWQHDLSPDALKAIMARYKRNEFAIVTHPQFKEEAKKIFGELLVFDTEEVKGLEFPTVLGYRLLDKENWAAANKKMLALGKTVEKSKTSMPKEGEADTSHDLDCNELYTFATRTTGDLYIANECPRHLQKVTEKIKSAIEVPAKAAEQTPTPAPVAQTTPAEWYKTAKELYDAGKLEQATAIRNSELVKDNTYLEKFDAYVKKQEEAALSSPRREKSAGLPILTHEVRPSGECQDGTNQSIPQVPQDSQSSDSRQMDPADKPRDDGLRGDDITTQPIAPIAPGAIPEVFIVDDIVKAAKEFVESGSLDQLRAQQAKQTQQTSRAQPARHAQQTITKASPASASKPNTGTAKQKFKFPAKFTVKNLVSYLKQPGVLEFLFTTDERNIVQFHYLIGEESRRKILLQTLDKIPKEDKRKILHYAFNTLVTMIQRYDHPSAKTKSKVLKGSFFSIMTTELAYYPVIASLVDSIDNISKEDLKQLAEKLIEPLIIKVDGKDYQTCAMMKLAYNEMYQHLLRALFATKPGILQYILEKHLFSCFNEFDLPENGSPFLVLSQTHYGCRLLIKLFETHPELIQAIPSSSIFDWREAKKSNQSKKIQSNTFTNLLILPAGRKLLNMILRNRPDFIKSITPTLLSQCCELIGMNKTNTGALVEEDQQKSSHEPNYVSLLASDDLAWVVGELFTTNDAFIDEFYHRWHSARMSTTYGKTKGQIYDVLQVTIRHRHYVDKNGKGQDLFLQILTKKPDFLFKTDDTRFCKSENEESIFYQLSMDPVFHPFLLERCNKNPAKTFESLEPSELFLIDQVSKDFPVKVLTKTDAGIALLKLIVSNNQEAKKLLIISYQAANSGVADYLPAGSAVNHVKEAIDAMPDTPDAREIRELIKSEKSPFEAATASATLPYDGHGLFEQRDAQQQTVTSASSSPDEAFVASSGVK